MVPAALLFAQIYFSKHVLYIFPENRDTIPAVEWVRRRAAF